MKADEPAERVVKYGMAAMDEDKLVERHFKVTQDDQAITAFHFAHALLIAPWLRSVMTGNPRRDQPIDAGHDAVVTPPAEEDLRKSLGLS